MAQFQKDGVSFQYPETWTLTPENYEAGWAVGLYSPATAFLTVTMDTSGTPPGLLTDAVLETLREEYKNLDSIPATDALGGLPAVGYDVEFFALDLTSTCVIRATSIEMGSLLIYWQVVDTEEQNQQLLRAIHASLMIADV